MKLRDWHVRTIAFCFLLAIVLLAMFGLEAATPPEPSFTPIQLPTI
ncbi:MAG: hypothetical protein LCH43_11480 [Actinobacteria bacterium]|nr:hypothetical protein [Actinomycetota bacterium]